jgi:phospholipase/carboxylesterase
MPPMLTRRRFAFAAARAAAAAAAFGPACVVSSREWPPAGGRLTVRARPTATTTLDSGALGLESGRDGVVQMPSAREGRLPLLLFLHGATQSGAGMLRRIGPAAARAGVVVVAPDSRETTWDAIGGGDFGADVDFLNRVLEHVFARVAVDPARIAIGGFSDGATYALSLGLGNGDLIPRVVACSPGFVVNLPRRGQPRFFVSHGVADPILPIDRCSRVIVPRLRAMGYDVTFREFDGRHEMPPDVADEAMRWAAAR